MTVAQAIEILKDMPQDATLCIELEHTDDNPHREIKDIADWTPIINEVRIVSGETQI